MPENIHNKNCKNCGMPVSANYCSNCGSPVNVKRITAKSILHEIFHFFTHLDKGFGFTIKQLVVVPGVMQRDYVDGNRAKYQKPFSMFFICGSVTALVRYWINIALVDYYHTGKAAEGDFFHQYFVILHTILLPLYATITWLLFYKAKYNYGEIVVFLLYTVGIFFLITDVVALIRLLLPTLNTDYIELAILLLYNAITYVHFFNNSPRWLTLLKSIANMVLVYFIANYAQDLATALLQHH